jgi:pimeloyl-ACP methyl ester carboxylesterase
MNANPRTSVAPTARAIRGDLTPPPARRGRNGKGILSALIVILSLGASSCYTLTRKDIFEVAFRPLAPGTMASLSDGHHAVQALQVAAAGRRVSAYWDRGDSSRGVLVFFNGNGYGAETALRRLLIPARKLKLDLVAFNYLDQGEGAPSMGQARAVARAVYSAAAALPTPAARLVYVGGHSLGATFALYVAATEPVAGLFVAAPVTTGVAMIRYQLPYSRLVSLRPDEDYVQLDSIKLAREVHRKVIVFG